MTLERVLAAMETGGIDALVLGRRDDVAYASGIRSLWTAGTRPFGAACVVVRSTRAVHLLSTWDAGVPATVPLENLYGITWNPRTMGAALAAIPGLSDAGRVGVDALSPGFAKAVSTIAPKAEVVAADLLMHSVRRTKSPAEQAAIAVAVDVVARGLDAVERAVGPGAVERQLAGVAVEAMARAGATVPASAPTVRIASPGRAGAGVLAEGDVVVIDLGVLLDGWEGGVGRTVVVGAPTAPQQALGARAQGRLAALVDVCRTGATGLDFQAAAGDATTWMVRGVGMGFEPPVITADLGADAALEAAMVLSVEVDCNEASVGTWRVRDLVAVSDRGPERLGTGP